MPKIWRLGPKITPDEHETAVLNQNIVISGRADLILYILLEKSAIFIKKHSRGVIYIRAQYFKKLHSEQRIFQL